MGAQTLVESQWSDYSNGEVLQRAEAPNIKGVKDQAELRVIGPTRCVQFDPWPPHELLGQVENRAPPKWQRQHNEEVVEEVHVWYEHYKPRRAHTDLP